MEFKTDIFKAFDKNWALLSAGNRDSFNSMTISWGMLGTIWSRPAATVYVRTSRYTHEFMDREDTFTVSFFPESMKDVLRIAGTRSGREIDKMHLQGLELCEDTDDIVYKNAEITLVCKKLFVQRLNAESIPAEVMASHYPTRDMHDMYIGEVVDVIYGQIVGDQK